RNVADTDVLKCIRMLTFLPLEQIDEMDKWEGSQLNTAKEILAFELTKMVHGEDEANKAQTAARAVFAGGGMSENMPTTELGDDVFTDGAIKIADLLVVGGLAPSKGEARRLIQQGGVMYGDKKAETFDEPVAKELFEGDGLIVKKGKKTFHRFTV
ncbi:MAG: tyrosine--tRNA ligase, partial [Clostridia bacterium]|nr:tyrosine--tRNA ligase [Clostridia bacterium]